MYLKNLPPGEPELNLTVSIYLELIRARHCQAILCNPHNALCHRCHNTHMQQKIKLKHTEVWGLLQTPWSLPSKQLVSNPGPRFPKCGPQTDSHVTWGLDRHAKPWAPPRPGDSDTLEVGLCV